MSLQRDTDVCQERRNGPAEKGLDRQTGARSRAGVGARARARILRGASPCMDSGVACERVEAEDREGDM